jgi:hyperosmotically inducible protein
MRKLALRLIFLGLLFVNSGCVGTSVPVVNPSPVRYLEDSVLTAKVKTAFLQQRGLEGLNIHVTSYQGVVQLSGFIDSDEKKELAGQIARSVDGVVEVVNNLIVKP